MSLKSILKSLFNSPERRVICPKCGAILSPKDPVLLDVIRKKLPDRLGRQLPISIQCPTCATFVAYWDEEGRPV